MGETPDAARGGARHGGVMTTIDHTSVAAALRRSGFTGPILEPADERFETERFGWKRRSTAGPPPSRSPPTPRTSPQRSRRPERPASH